MRLLLIIGILAMLSMGVASAAGNNMTIAAGTNETFADNRAMQIVVNLTNATGHPVNDTRVNFTTTLGTLSASYDYTNASGIAVVNIGSWDLGTANVTAQAPNAANVSVNVTFVRGPVYKIVLTHNFTGTVNTTHPVTATVYDQTAVKFSDDESKWRVMPNVTLNFSIASPPSSTYDSANITPRSNTTDESGVTTAIALIDKCAGNNLITVNVTNEDGHLKSILEPIVGEAGESTRLFLDADPQEVVANNIDISRVIGTTTDEFLNPLLSRGLIEFNTTENVRTIHLDGTGRASITIGPNIFTGNVTVNGTYFNEAGYPTNLTNSTVVNFYAEEPVRIVLSSDVRRISTTLDPKKARITAVVVDEWGHALTYKIVNFSRAGVGDLTHTQVNTLGVAQAVTSLSSDTAGDVLVTASTMNDTGVEITASITINVTDQAFVSVNTTIEPNPVLPGGIINVTTIIEGHGNITGTRDTAHAVLTLDRSGSMDPDYYAGTPLDIVEVLDRSDSMRHGGAFADAQKAATMFLDNMVSNSQVGVVSYSTDCTIDQPLTLLNASDNKPLIKDAINSLSTDLHTAMGDGMLNASRMLSGELDSNARNHSRKIMIVLTDGINTHGSDPMAALAHAQTNGITIYTIGLGSSLDETLLRYIAYETGGKYYNAPESSELQGIYQRIAQEISDYDVTEIEYSKEGFTPYNYEESPSLLPVNRTGTFTLRYYADGIANGCNNISINGQNLGYIPAGTGTQSHDITAYVVNGTNMIRFYQTINDGMYFKDVLVLVDNRTVASYPGRVDLRTIKGRTFDCTFTTTYHTYPYPRLFELKYNATNVTNANNTISINDQNIGCIPSGTGNRSHDISAYIVNGINMIEFNQTENDDFSIRNISILEDSETIESYPGPFYLNCSNGSTYNCTFATTTHEFLVNERINDLKTTLDWSGEHDLDLHVTDPDAHVYGEGDDTTGYYFDDRIAAPIDPEYSDYDTYISSLYPDSNFASDTYFHVCDRYNDSDSSSSSILRFALPANEPTKNANIESVVMRVRLFNYYRFRLRFEGYDMDEALNYTVWVPPSSGGDGGSETPGYNDTRYTGECRVRLNGANFTFIPATPTPENDKNWTSYGYWINYPIDGVNTIDFTDWFNLTGHGDEENRIRNVTITYDNVVIANYSTTNVSLNATPVNYTFVVPTDPRYVRIHDMGTTDYTDSGVTWNNRDGTNPWDNGGNFSTSDYNPYTIASMYLESGRWNGYLRTDITDAIWGSDRTPDWGESCNLVLIGEGYDGNDTYPWSDRFRTGYSRIEITYSIDKDTSESIWTHPLPGAYLNNTDYSYVDSDNLENMTWGNWEVLATGTEDDLVDEPNASVAPTEIWFTANLSASSDATYYLYYGNPGATSQGYSGDDVFTFFEDFEDGMPGLGSYRPATGQDTTGIWDLSPTVVNHGHHSLHVTEGDSWKDQEILEIDLSEGYVLGFTARTDDGGEVYGVGVHDGTGTHWNDALIYRAGGYEGTDVCLPHAGAGAWKEYEVDITSDWWDCQGDYVTLNYLTYIADDDADPSADAYWDYIYMRKHVDSEPAVGGLSNFSRSRKIIVTSAEPLIDYQVKFTVNYSSVMQPDFDDLRFTAADGTLLSYWIEDKTDNVSADVWVNVSSVATGNTTIYLYYGDPYAMAGSDGAATFELFDDFSGQDLDRDVWGTRSTYSSHSVGDRLDIYTGNIYTQSPVATTPQNRTIEMLARYDRGNGNQDHSGICIADVQSTQHIDNNPEGNALVYAMTEAWGGYDIEMRGADGTVASNNIVNDVDLMKTPTLGTDYIIGYSFRGSSHISWFVKDATTYADLNRTTYADTWDRPFYLWLGYFTGSTASTTNIDDLGVTWVRVRKYAAIEPTAISATDVSASPAGAWWDTSWAHRMPINLTEQSGTDLTTYPVKITIDTPALIADGLVQIDLSDIRIIDESGNEVPWTPRIRGRSQPEVAINLSNHIDKKSATQLASHAFISSLDHSRNDTVGMVTYSYKDPADGHDIGVQQSYVCEGNQWEGYFTANATDAEPVYYFSLDWSDASDLDLYLYDGVTLLDSSVTAEKPERVSGYLTASRTYRVVVNGTSIVGNDTEFTIDVSKSPIQTMCTYYDDSRYRNPQHAYDGQNISRYRYWTGSEWTGYGMDEEGEANPVEGRYDIYQTVLRSAPTRNESILGTIDFYSDLNVQVWNGSEWGETLELSTDTYNTRKSFDIAYEQSTERAMVVYRNNSVSNTVPAYALWDGAGWTHGSVQNVGTHTIIQVRVVPDPDSDEIMLVTMDTDYDIYAQVWDGSAWGNVRMLTGSGRTYDYLCFDAAYEYGTGEAVVVWGQTDNNMYYRKWDGVANWDAGSTLISTTGRPPYWIKLASDPTSNQILMGVLDDHYDINVNVWDGSTWNASSSALEVETDASYWPRRSFDVAFEQTSGDAIVAWGDRTGTPKYKVWDGAGWAAEQSASDVGSGYIYWVQLEPDMGSDDIFLMTSDCDSDINIQKWDGAAWSAAAEVETQSVYGTQWEYGYESFGITSPTSTQTMCVYYDYAPNSKSDVPRYKLWDGSAWSEENVANPVCGNTYDEYARFLYGQSVIRASPTSSEFILGTIDYAKDINVQVWDDAGWSSPRVLSNTTNYGSPRAFDIAYEQLSGRAMVVYKGDCDTNVPEYQIWDGSTSTWAGGYVNSSIGDWMAMNRVDRLIPKPGTNEILLLTMNWHNDLYAQIWNGSAWGDTHLITATARTSGYQCFDAAYEYDTGEFVVVWSNINYTPNPDVYEMCYCTYNGTWSESISMYQYNDTIDLVYWVRLASDPNSNNIIMGTQDRDNDGASDDPAINVSAWNGSGWSQQLRIEDHAPDQSEGYRYFDVAFEQSSGRGMIAWSDNTYTPKYRTWNGMAWSNETSASNVGHYTRWVRLEPDPLSDEIFLMTSDRANDINLQRWDGSEWSDAVELESRSYYGYECFDITCRDTTPAPTNVTWFEWRAVTDVTLIQSSLDFDAINESVDSLTADGMTAIDEGLFNANNALHDYFNPEPIENGTIVLMTDGIDNVGYHSMIKEAEYAASNDTKIYTIGFGSDIDDRVLRQIANITGGEYYFAPNAAVLKEIFEGIAGELGNFTAADPKINLHLGNNSSIEGAWTNVTYIDDSSDIAYFNCTCDSCDVELGGVCEGGDGHANGTYWDEPSPAANPAINTSDENITRLNWSVGNRFPPTYAPPYAITTERSWTVRYQLQIGEDCANVINAIIDPSFDCGGGHGDPDLPDVTVTVGGNASDEGDVSDAANCTLINTSEYNDPPKGIRESAYKIEAKFTNSSGAVSDVEGLIVEFWASTGTLTNYTLSDPGEYSQPSNHVFCKWGAGSTWPHVRLRSTSPGSIRVWSSCLKEDGEYINASTRVTFHSLEAPPMIPPAPRPRGVITLE